MLLNIFAEPITKVVACKTFRKLSTTLKMNSNTQHCKTMSLSDQAIQFRTAYGIPNGKKNRTMQLDLIVEEFHEFCYAAGHESYENELKELADLVYVCFQYAENMEWDLEEALDRVHKSNMSKLGINGKPIRRRDGKVLKGPNYQPPELTDLINP
jgi:NTP pyrophosphatase (non-canonical NTP hydrolase)